MKTSRFTDSQIIAVLKEAEAGTPVPALGRTHGIRSATFYKWRAQFGGMAVPMVARMKELEEENRRLKKMYAAAQPSTRFRRTARPSPMPVPRLRSARRATATRADASMRMPRWPTGWCG